MDEARIYLNSDAPVDELRLLPPLRTFTGKISYQIKKIENQRKNIQGTVRSNSTCPWVESVYWPWKDSMNEVYYPDSIDEFLEEHVDFHLSKFKDSADLVQKSINTTLT